MQAPDELFRLAEGYLAGLELMPELGAQQDSMRYALEGGKRIRAVICLATAEAGEDIVATAIARTVTFIRAFLQR